MNYRIFLQSVVFVALSLFLSGCSENESNYVLPSMATVPEIEIEYCPEIIMNGILHFETSAELKSAIKSLSKMSVTERRMWEQKYQFISMQSKLEYAYDEIDKATTIEEIQLIVSKYKNLIELKGEEIVEKNSFGAYQLICNTDGLYSTSDFLCELKGNALNTYKLSDYLKNGTTISLTPISKNVVDCQSKTSSCNYVESSVTVDERFCNNDRRVKISSSFYVVCATWTVRADPPFIYTEYSPAIEIHVWGQRKRACIWTNYKTKYSFRNLNYSVNGYKNSQAQNFGDYLGNYIVTSSIIFNWIGSYSYYETPNDDYYGFYNTDFIGHRAVNEPTITGNTKLLKIYIEGSSRGVGDKWAIINCSN